MSDSKKLDQVLLELQGVKQELAEIKRNQPMFAPAGASNVSISVANQNNTCPSCGSMQFAPIDFSQPIFSPNLFVDTIPLPGTTFTFSWDPAT